ncbi:MAG: TetR/AcrR family transcriptional regulator [Methanoregulaceae archaeon]
MPKIFPKYKEEAKKKIIQAAMTVGARKGYQTMTMEDIAGEVGVTKGALYVYFRNKEDLFNEVMIGISDRIRETMEYSRTGGDLNAVLNRMSDNLFSVMTPNIPVFAELVSISSRDPVMHRRVADMLQRNIQVIEEELQTLQMQKMIDEDMDLKSAVRSVVALSQGLGIGVFLGADREETKRLWIESMKKILGIPMQR